MRNDQIFVLLLVVLLPLSGCFDAAVGDVEGQAESADSENDDMNSDTGLIALGGVQYTPADAGNTHYSVATFNSSAGQLIQVVEEDVTNSSNINLHVQTECIGGEYYMNSPGGNYQLTPFYLPGSFTDCTHTVQIHVYHNEERNMSWSFVYGFSAVTVG